LHLNAAAWREIFSVPFAVSLVFTSYAFTGWNAAGYIAGEIRAPERTIPRALLVGTALVTALFAGLNWSFLRTVPLGALAGRVDVGALSATAMFGRTGTIVMSGLIALVLMATISALVLGGSRVTQAVTADLPRWVHLGVRGADGVPRAAILGQLVLIIALIVTDSFEAVMLCAGFTLNLMSLLTVVGMVRLRWRQPNAVRAYRTWGYPLTPIVYVVLSVWTLITILMERPRESLVGVGTVAIGAVLWALAHRSRRGAAEREPRSAEVER
jgi:basic amino acid/polyamine antiporter, APA family